MKANRRIRASDISNRRAFIENIHGGDQTPSLGDHDGVHSVRHLWGVSFEHEHDGLARRRVGIGQHHRLAGENSEELAESPIKVGSVQFVDHQPAILLYGFQ